jgi:hypothetical protein
MNNEQDILLMESLLNNLGISLKEAPVRSANKKAVKALVDAYPDKFNSQSESNRISNLQKISPEEFIQLVKQTFDGTNVVTRLFIQASNGFIGIGTQTSTPSARLQVRGSGSTSSSTSSSPSSTLSPR